MSASTGMMDYAIVDLETTGLFPATHRVIEVSIIRADYSGNVKEQYTTLINPNRDLGDIARHGISGELVVNAPSFADVAGDIAALMRNALPVGHNVSFDLRFLRSEFQRLGYSVPDRPFICTMALANRVAPELSSRKLSCCCTHFRISLKHAHSAANDARATLALFLACRQIMEPAMDDGNDDFADEENGTSCEWPVLSRRGCCYTRQQASEQVEEMNSYLGNLINRLPAAQSNEPSANEYMALLDRALEDRRLTINEADQIYELAQTLGLSKEQAISLSMRYFTDLVRVAWADGIITEAEQQDLNAVGALLNIDETDRQSTILQVKTEATPQRSQPNQSSDTLVGKSVCFTGEMTCKIDGVTITRDMAEALATEKGLNVKSGVSKKLDILVVADPASMSGKAKKARELGVRILAEPVFWRMAGVGVE